MRDEVLGSDAAMKARREFDAAFTRPPSVETAETVDLLALRLGESLYAVDAREITGVAALRRIVPLPTRSQVLLGLTGIKGALIPVYSLDALLGHERAEAGPPRWVVLCRSEETVGFAFDVLEGHRRIPREDLFVPQSGELIHSHVEKAARLEGSVRMVIHMQSLVHAISRGSSAPTQRSDNE